MNKTDLDSEFERYIHVGHMDINSYAQVEVLPVVNDTFGSR